MSGQRILEIDSLSVSYGPAAALTNVSLQVDSGETVAILGANGAGKTTLLHAISGIRNKKTGRVRFLGEDITKMPPHRIVASGIVQVPEGRMALPKMSVLENILVGAHSRVDNANLKRDLDELLDIFPDLRPRLGERAAALSGGQQQMLVLCRGLIAKPRLFMLDEPSLGLAPILVDQVFEIMVALKARGLSMLLVEQNVRKALTISDRAYVLELGKVALSGRREELLADPRVAKLYLGSDATE